METPKVSCIMPTANRHKYIPFAIEYFLYQEYQNSELIIVDDGKVPVSELIPEHPSIKYYYIAPLGKIGTKRNYCCEKASGEIIMHWDDDDWHAKDWITQQVNFLITSGADITGIEHVHFFSPIEDTFWRGTALNRNNPINQSTWINGASLAYWKSFWKLHQFKDLQIGEDDDFIRSSGAKVYAHDYIDGLIVMLHPHNTTAKYFENKSYKIYK